MRNQVSYASSSVLLALLALTAAGCGRQQEARPAAVAAAAASTGFEQLPGKWVRPDGGYVLEIKSAGPGGELDAGYFNPGPIKVAAAKATKDAGTIKVFVELRDEGYPGCTYSLVYDPQDDQLKGTYFQAAMRQNYDIFFVRLNE